MIRTLDPSAYTTEDILDISGLQAPEIRLAGRTDPGSCGVGIARYEGMRVTRTGVTGNGYSHVPFPAGTAGIFYFQNRTSIHPLAGDIRFRVLPVDAVRDWELVDTADLFAMGHDLLLTDGFSPWSISLLSLAVKRRLGFYDFMKERGYITEEAEMQLKAVKRSVSGHGVKYMQGRGKILEHITDPFVLDLHPTMTSLILLQEERIVPHIFITRQITAKRLKSTTGQSIAPGYPPYSGMFVCGVVAPNVLMKVLRYGACALRNGSRRNP